jgi:hypothetical protein
MMTMGTISAELKEPLLGKEAPSTPRTHLRNQLHIRKPSLTDTEMAFLSALLIDNPPSNKHGDDEKQDKKSDSLPPKVRKAPGLEAVQEASKVLDDDMLFTVPDDGFLIEHDDIKALKRPKVTKKPHQYRFLVGLWQAHEDGVSPKKLSSLHQRTAVKDVLKRVAEEEIDDDNDEAPKKEVSAAVSQNEMSTMDDDDGNESVKSDEKIVDDDNLSDISWEEEDIKHFDAWQVLKDEYASDFGFDYSPDGAMPSEDETEMEPNTFKILGTSAEEQSAHPHVLSPPLMDAIINFVPEHLKGQNLWNKFSLVRDGASLETFKRYARASKDTILSIETTRGQVFGCYASTPWRTAPMFYGGSPSFVFRMRHNRNTPCHSLVEQAQMEGEIDVFFFLEDGQKPQLCTHDMIGVGEGSLQKYDSYGEITETTEEAEVRTGKNYGFALALNDDLLSGTTSNCSSYKNPCLVDANSHGEPFEVLNLELWTFTPCFSLESAEKLEMTQFFVSESMRNVSMRSTTSTERSVFSSQDLSQDQFYRRVGQGDDHEELRERWQYRNMMDTDRGPSGLGASPRFNNSTT